jgi:hypothetical protein
MIPAAPAASYEESGHLSCRACGGMKIDHEKDTHMRCPSKPSLSEASGRFLHARQDAPLTPYEVQKNGTKYQDLPAEAFEGRDPRLQVRPGGPALWGWGSYEVSPDGTLKLFHYHYDSSD